MYLPQVSPGLDELIRTDLQNCRDSYFWWLIFSAAVVAIGVIFEGPEVIFETVGICRRRFGKQSEPQRHAPDWVTLVALLGWILVAVGVAGEGIAEGYVSWADGNLQTFNDILLGDAQKEAGAANQKAAEANERAAKNEKEAAQLRKDAEGERLARVKLQKQIQPRTMGEVERKKLGEQLRKFAPNFKGRKVKMSSQVGDAESMLFALEIADVLDKAGIEPDVSGLGRMLPMSSVYVGLIMTGNSKDEAFLRALTTGLNSIVTPSVIKAEWKPKNVDVEITVGVKPIVGLTEDAFPKDAIPKE
jgi:hypothetical protein